MYLRDFDITNGMSIVLGKKSQTEFAKSGSKTLHIVHRTGNDSGWFL